MDDLRAVLIGCGVHGALEAGAAGLEGASGNVILQQLFVDNVDDGRDQGLDVFVACLESLDVAFCFQSEIAGQPQAILR